MSSLDDVSNCVACGGGGEEQQYDKVKQYNSRQNSHITDEVAMDRQATGKCSSKKRTSSSRSSLLYTTYLLITLYLLIIPPSSSATQVKWQPNNNIKPENQAAHNAPRSQKYWDENNIKRPDYAKTDAEVAAERGEGSGGLLGLFLKTSIGIVLLAVVYARITGDWDSILNNPVGSYITDWINWILELIGVKGNRLGSSSTEEQTMPSGEARRLARLARFDSPKKNMLDDLKAD